MQRRREPSRPAFPYLRVLEALRQDVLALAPGSAAPSETELAARHGVSRMTARNAVLVLRQEGLLYVVRGRGVYVARRKLDLHDTPAPLGFTEMARQHGLAPSTRLLRFDRGHADSALASRLGVADGEPVFFVERLRFADAAPMCHELTAVPVAVCPTLFRRNLEADSLYRILIEDHGHALSGYAEEVEAGAAGRTMARLFRIAATDPVLIARRVVYGRQGRPVEWTLGTYRADRYRASYRMGAAPPMPPADRKGTPTRS
jgi:GntR family transcriptional regulator